MLEFQFHFLPRIFPGVLTYIITTLSRHFLKASKNPRIITIDGTAEEALKQMEQPTVVSFVPVVTDMTTMTLAGLVTMNMLISSVD